VCLVSKWEDRRSKELLQRSPNILLIPGTSSVAHLRENLAATELKLSQAIVEQLDAIATSTSQTELTTN
jgi:aryl-alcohol dehydrogenase-like predicted oxidoreductase